MMSLEQSHKSEQMNLIKSEVRIGEHGGWLSADGLPLMGITRWIDAVLCGGDFSKWKFVDIPDHILRAAAERGTRVHREIEMMCNGFKYDDSEVCEVAEKLLPKQEYITEYIVSDNKMFASAIDLLGEDFSIWDIKTNSKIDNDIMLKFQHQLSIYKYLFERQTGEKAGAMKILWINKQLKNAVYDVEYLGDEYISDFLYNPQHFEWYKQFVKVSKEK